MVYVNIMFPMKPFSTGFSTDKNDLSTSGSSSAYQPAYQAPVSSIQFPQMGKDPLSDYHHLPQRVPLPPVHQHWSSLPSPQQPLQPDFQLQLQHSSSSDHKKYQCSRCDLKFTRNSSLKRHIKSKHLYLKYKCDICPNYFNKRKDYLQRHMFIKHGMCREEFNRKNYKQDYVFEEDDRRQYLRAVRKFSFDSQTTQGDQYEDEQSLLRALQQYECGSASSASPTLPQDQLYTPPSVQTQPQLAQQNQLPQHFIAPSQQKGFAYPTSEPNRVNSQDFFLDYFSPSTNQLQAQHQAQQQQMMQLQLQQQAYYYQHFQQMQELPPPASHRQLQQPQAQLVDSRGAYIAPVLSSKMIIKGLYDHLNNSNSPFNPTLGNSSVNNTQGQLYRQGHIYETGGDQDMKREDLSKTPQLETVVKEEN